MTEAHASFERSGFARLNWSRISAFGFRISDWYRSTFGQALIGAVLLWAALPPLGLWPLAWIAPVWWVHAHPPREAAAAAAVTRSARATSAMDPADRGRALFPGRIGRQRLVPFHAVPPVLDGRHGLLARPAGDFPGRRAALGVAALSIACGWPACSSGWPPCTGCGCRTGPSASAGWPWGSISAAICRCLSACRGSAFTSCGCP